MRAYSYLVVALSAVVIASPSKKPFFYKGHDLSSLQILEDGGASYKDTARGNATRPVEDILGDGGMNTVRLRLWVNPTIPFDGPPGYYETYNLNYTVSLAQRFHAKGYKIYLDYHFSDYWADPQKQAQPIAWPKTLPPLARTLRSYVSNTLQTFHQAGVDLALVSLGNEIRNGMLWPLGRVSVNLEPESARIANFTGLATLYTAARKGVDDAIRTGISKPQIMIHIDNGYDLRLQQRWFSALLATGTVKISDWDVFGFSIYPFYGTAATLANLKNSVNWIAEKFGKPIHIVETDWPAICTGDEIPSLSEPGIVASVDGQLEWVGKVVDVVKQIPDGLGQGINYWEPAWLNNTGLGSACQDAILFDADWSEFPKVVAYSRKSVGMFKGV
ncbi:related to arabinogalactan endo-1,4-beta-galactosidase [Ramularia collo-cygni]|uniref:Arabinogalactan endo-beta-1,4-galactanase n=1 Tax=Ramularia collo-cygni TaxID=112498 RepID=A0A2D3VDE7_9PEZI|nr:related to arabinogalactan endo-1,4-beta-galactosidase [Ramularia collo-cygni]CZT23072.1 related to arabinogalactan endo-1,4-beta-galactosidase [Ramularia collo-cygni]